MPIELTMPRLSDTMEQGTIIKWNVKEGDHVAAGDAVADIETDKATMEMQVYDNGTMARIVIAEGQTVEVGTVIAVMAGEGEDAARVAAAAPAAPPVAAGAGHERKEHLGRADAARAATREPAGEAQGPQPKQPAPQTSPAEAAGDGRIRMSPLARRLADEHGLDAGTIEGSGPGGRIVKRDVMRALEAQQETAAAVPPSARTAVPATPVALRAPAPLRQQVIPLSPMRQTIARRLLESKSTIPHYQVTVVFDVDSLITLRQTLNEQLASQNVKLSLNDFLIRACALAIHQHPELNSSWGGDHIEVHGDVNIGLAIALPRERGGGLLVGTLRNADRKSLRAISEESRYLSDKARSRGLTIEEMSDSTFTISNLGMYGVDNFTAIINPPNCGILSVGAAAPRPVVRRGELAVGHQMTATLNVDHRIVDGATAAAYLASVRELLEQPATLLV